MIAEISLILKTIQRMLINEGHADFTEEITEGTLLCKDLNMSFNDFTYFLVKLYDVYDFPCIVDKKGFESLTVGDLVETVERRNNEN